ncbi:MAG: sodium:solute symporter family protein [Myxococcales bacterium]|nr:sodium:solute symporter family protein [Myxococcales bacterium]
MNVVDPVGLSIMSIYLLALIAIGFASRFARRENSLGDFYLGGRGLGTLVLFLTLYATQYSGLTLVGFAGQAYRSGFTFLVSVTFACSVIGGYVMIAPRLRTLSERHGFITIGDFIQHRYGSARLTAWTTGVFVFALATYVLSNLKAAGYVIEAASGGRIGMAAGIIGLSVLIAAYETLGGLRAVAWTDTLQGGVLCFGCAAAFFTIVDHYGWSDSMMQLATARPDFFAAPSTAQQTGWLSTLVLVMFGVSIYPHAVQRIYAAVSRRALLRSMQLMLLMPFITTLPMLAVGYIGAAHFPDLSQTQSEQVVFVVLGRLSETITALGPLVALLVCALLAAIMSTVDSALLAISSLVTQDLYARLRPGNSQEALTRLGKRFSWALMAALVGLAIALPQTLWRITEVKLEVLVQMAPAVFIGLHLPQVRARDIGWGLVIGLTVTLGVPLAATLTSTLAERPLGVHAGVWGLAANLGTVLWRDAHGPDDP